MMIRKVRSEAAKKAAAKRKAKPLSDRFLATVDSQLRICTFGLPAWVDTRSGRVHGFLCRIGCPKRDRKEAMLITSMTVDEHGDRKQTYKVYPWHRINCPSLFLENGVVRPL
jgi:hypothetical protein